MKPPKDREKVKDEGHRSSEEIIATSNGYNPEEEKAVLRKIDMVILPFVRSPYSPLFWRVTDPTACRCVLSSFCNI